MIEQWLPISGWGAYEVSDLGGVRSIDRTVVRSDGKVKRFKGKTIAGFTDDRGYTNVHLRRGPLRKSFWVHRLVLEAFVGPCPEGMECLHGPGGNSDNRLVNLRWGTKAENEADKVRDGTDQYSVMAQNSILTEDDVVMIRELFLFGYTLSQLSELYGVTAANISCVVNRKSWRNVA